MQYGSLNMNDNEKAIEEFLKRYAKEYDFFDQASRLAAQKLGGSLRASGIRSIVTSRAKAIASLEARVRERNEYKNYSTADAIFDDVIDLAGVRVALYFPDELPSADNVIRSLFKLELDPPKGFPNPKAKPRYTKRFSGYRATHYRAYLNAEILTDEEKRYAKQRIEIQVASVLMHSWAEVEHDLVYKPMQGRLSEEEYDTLDELNGLILAGEIAL